MKQQGRSEQRRYFIGGDNSGHEYIVPCDKASEWNAWSELSDDDERKWDVPEYAVQIEGYLTFTSPSTEPWQ